MRLASSIHHAWPGWHQQLFSRMSTVSLHLAASASALATEQQGAHASSYPHRPHLIRKFQLQTSVCWCKPGKTWQYRGMTDCTLCRCWRRWAGFDWHFRTHSRGQDHRSSSLGDDGAGGCQPKAQREVPFHCSCQACIARRWGRVTQGCHAAHALGGCLQCCEDSMSWRCTEWCI